jgi:hypothetical protein
MNRYGSSPLAEVCHASPVGMGLPSAWETLADWVWLEYRHRLVLRRPPEGRDSDVSLIDVYLDGDLTAGISFTWPDVEPVEQVLDNLWNALEDLLVEDLHNRLPDESEHEQRLDSWLRRNAGPAGSALAHDDHS